MSNHISDKKNIIGLLTSDSRLFFDLVKELRFRGLPFRSLNFGEAPPMDIGVILTSQYDVDKVERTAWGSSMPIIPVDDIYKGIRRAFQALTGIEIFEELVIGVDPGKEPGIAVLVNNEVLEVSQARSWDKCVEIIHHMLDSYIFRTSRLKLGNGAPESRDFILDHVADSFTVVEVMDEFRTTKLTKNMESDKDAAINIARSRRIVKKIHNGNH